ncbi:MAG: ABC transporter ATP-binding protein [Xanthobacteraceae bacterium]|nr:ABC transporter ATP-binding protein [Xanthobacteraceae bacterium]
MTLEAGELRVENLRGGYAGTVVLEGVSFRIGAGGKLGILGRNGVGKTTMFACIMGLAQIHGGRITFGGTDVTALPTWRRARAGLGYVPQTRDIFKSLSVEENLFSAVRSAADDKRVEAAFALFPRLRERRNNNGTQLSGGEQQMLAVARATISGPTLLLMDEPLEGLAPRLRDELMDAIRNMVETSGIGCLLVEQHVDVVLDFADEVLILERGKPVYVGGVDELREDPSILDHAIGLRKGTREGSSIARAW